MQLKLCARPLTNAAHVCVWWMSKRRCVSGISGAPAAKHKLGYDPSWVETFLWVVPVSDSDSATTTTVVVCSLCCRHRTHQRNTSGTWAEKACRYLHKDVLERHERSAMHAEAMEHVVATLWWDTASVQPASYTTTKGALRSTQDGLLVGEKRGRPYDHVFLCNLF